MCNSTTDHPAFALRRQQSLLRSLSAIHRTPHGHAALPSANNRVFDETRPGGPSKSDRPRIRRGGPSSRAVAPDLSAQDLPPLPFSKDGSSNPAHERPAKKFQRLRRRTSVTFAPETLPFSVPAAEKCPKQQHNGPKQQHNGFRGDYSLGDAIRCPSHMIVEATPELARRAVGSLNVHDFAFVRRSDGSYTYAILAYRSVEPDERAEGTMEECMNFVVSEGGSTKMVRERRWDEYVRMVSAEGSCCDPAAGACSCHRASVPVDPPASCEEVRHEIRVDWVPPNVIIVVPQMDEECSLMSSVSDRARGL